MAAYTAADEPLFDPQYVSHPHKLDLTLSFRGEPLQLQMGALSFAERNEWASQRHSNADFELHILLGGSASVEVDGQLYPMAAGNAVLIAPGTLHCSHAPSADIDRFTLRFMPPADSALHRALLAHVGSCLRFDCGDTTLRLCHAIVDEYAARRPFREECLRGLYLQLLAQILRCVQFSLPGSDRDGSTQTNQERVIMDRFFFPWPNGYGTEKDLAELLHVSTRQLHRILLQNYGMSFRRKLVQSRMESAGGLLQTTDERIGAIAIRLGYKEVSSFFKAFGSYYGMTPREYRRKTRQK